MPQIYVVKWGAWRYIVSEVNSAMFMFPNYARLPAFKDEGEAIAHCEMLNDRKRMAVATTMESIGA